MIEGLCIGDEPAAKTKADLLNAGITHILCVARECQEYHPGEFKFLKVALEDDPSQDVLSIFGQTNEFIEMAIAEGGKVLVHCYHGMSRSGTCVTAALMKFKRMRYKAAFDLLKQKHDIACLNSGFMA